MKATLLLGDYAQVSEGKLTVVGAGWVFCPANGANMAIGIILDVPWDMTNREHALSLRLLEEDGPVVQQPGPAGLTPVTVQAGFEVGRPVGHAQGSTLPVAFALPVLGLQLQPGRRYYWELSVDGETREDWTLHFATRPIDQ